MRRSPFGREEPFAAPQHIFRFGQQQAVVQGKDSERQLIGDLRGIQAIFRSRPVAAVQATARIHAVVDRKMAPRGCTTVDGEKGDDIQRNSRFGATLDYPWEKRQAIKVSISGGVVTNTGNDFNAIGLSYIRLLNLPVLFRNLIYTRLYDQA
jgi:hypothetical protein